MSGILKPILRPILRPVLRSVFGAMPRGGERWTPMLLFSEGALGLWYDPSNPASVWKDTAGTEPALVGDLVARMDDLSGNGHHAIQATESRRPTLRQNTAGRRYLEFGGPSDRRFLATASGVDLSGTNKMTFIAGLRRMSDAAIGFVANQNSNINPAWQVLSPVSSNTRASLSINGDAVSSTFVVTPPAPTSYVLTGLTDQDLPLTRVRFNGGDWAEDSTTTGLTGFGNTPIHIGQRSSGTSRFHGHLYGFVLIGRVLGGDELEKSEAWMGERAGLNDIPATAQIIWTGVPTSDGVTATARLSDGGTAESVRMVVSKSNDLEDPVYTSPEAPDEFRIARHTVSGLDADTEHCYAFEVDGVLDSSRVGRFRTLPAGAVSSFSFTVGCCQSSGTNITPAMDAIRAMNPRPLFHVLHGDLHYYDVQSAIPNPTELDFHAAFDSCFANPTKRQFVAEVPQAYIWDDHDFINGDTGGYSSTGVKNVARDAAVRVYRSRVPCTPVSPGDSDAVYFSFVVGRLRVVMMDLRSDRVQSTSPAPRQIMSETQMQWIKSEIDAAKVSEQGVALVSSSPFLASEVGSEASDNWGAYPAQRTELANYVKSEGMEGRVFILAGDMHGLAISEGADYATGGGGSMPVFHAGPLYRTSTLKGGPYEHGPYPPVAGDLVSQYGVVNVTDDEDGIGIEFVGMSADGTERMRYSFTIPI